MEIKPSQSILPLVAPRGRTAHEVRALVGIDGGGTHTRLRLTRLDGHVLGEGQAGASALGQGINQAWQHIEKAFQEAVSRSGLSSLRWDECSVGAGLSGASVEANARGFIAAQPGCARLVLDTDGFTGVLGAHGGAPGALLIGGTGSVCAVLRADGRRDTIGGWGWSVGDEGSGAWLGKEALRHAQRALDGRDPVGPFARALWRRFDFDSNLADTLRSWSAQAGQQALAGLAPLVFEYEKIDPTAARLLNEAALELESLADAADPDAELPLALAGSVAVRLADRLSRPLRSRCRTAMADAAAGALHLARCALEEKSLA